MRRFALLMLCALAATSCSAVLQFHECNSDSDCVGMGPDGGALYCTDDHMCVAAIPDYKLCSVSVPSDGKIPDGALVVGGEYRLTPADNNDHAFREAADLAAMDFIAAGYNVAHVVCDTQGDPDLARRSYDVLADRFGAKVVVGPDTSNEVLGVPAADGMGGVPGVADAVKDKGVPIVSPSATNPRISSLDDDHLIWRTAASDNLQAQILATLPTASSTVAVVYDGGSNYTIGLSNAFVAAYSPIGTVVGPYGFTSGDQSSIDMAVMMAAATQPPYVLLIADPDAPALLASVAKASGFAMTQILMTDGAKKPSLWGDLGGNYTVLARVHGTAPANPDPSDPSGKGFAVFAVNFKNKFGEDPAETAYTNNTYDAFYVAAFAGLALAPSQRTGANIVANLGRMSDAAAQTVPIGPNGVTQGVTGLSSGTINVVGTSGPIDFDGNGDVVSAPIEKWSVDTSGATPTFKTDKIITQ